ncbi:hypothetical protein CALCODRAFT_487074 [Calocera cornea HHB12733]|uniref:Uncharacterized protein n=1 Tax=Calocera cornea HHB12733 TaxID=1353952 RepID=A0A165DCC4_9BASI|nr:hypothetical protein CALCODRAFT_487074 [Calocera cornea HHB12733]
MEWASALEPGRQRACADPTRPRSAGLGGEGVQKPRPAVAPGWHSHDHPPPPRPLACSLHLLLSTPAPAPSSDPYPPARPTARSASEARSTKPGWTARGLCSGVLRPRLAPLCVCVADTARQLGGPSKPATHSDQHQNQHHQQQQEAIAPPRPGSLRLLSPSLALQARAAPPSPCAIFCLAHLPLARLAAFAYPTPGAHRPSTIV